MKRLFYVGIGGGIGSCLRYSASLLIERLSFGAATAVFSVNIAGCFLAGLGAALLSRFGLLKEDHHAFLMTGLIGGFTTFSAFAIETFALWHKARPTALAYALAQTSLCLVAVFAGHQAGR